jgi:hypothetical protein
MTLSLWCRTVHKMWGLKYSATHSVKLNEKVNCTPHKLWTLLKAADGCNGKKKQGLGSQSQSYFTTGGIRPIVRLGVKSLETHEDRSLFSFSTESLRNILSDEKSGLSLMNNLSSCVRIALIACYWAFFLVHHMQVLCYYRFCTADHAYHTYPILKQQLSHLNGS